MSREHWVVRLRIDDRDAELAADRLWTKGATAIEERAGDGLLLEAGFPTDEAARLVAAELAAEGWPAEAVDLGPDVWLDTWREHATPVDVGQRLTVAPAWRDTPLAGGRIVMRLDPGRAFGSGSHPTSRMLLGVLERSDLAGVTVLDVGTGSGILAIAAVLLGARHAVGVDIDPEAIAVAERNALANGVADRTDFSTTALERVDGDFDLVVANLSAATLAQLARPLLDRMAPHAKLVLSGLLPGQWAHVAGGFAGLSETHTLDLEGWEARILTR